jgi:hypothetical protein
MILRCLSYLLKHEKNSQAHGLCDKMDRELRLVGYPFSADGQNQKDGLADRDSMASNESKR